MEAAVEADDAALQSRLLGSIGNVYASIGDYERAVAYFLEGYDRAVKETNQQLQFKYATNLVAAYCFLGKPSEALAFYSIQADMPFDESMVKRYYLLHNRSLISKAEGNLPMAVYYSRQAYDFATEHTMSPELSFTQLTHLARLLNAKGSHAEALASLRQASDFGFEEIGLQHQAEYLRVMSETFAAVGAKDSAAIYSAQAVALSDSIYNQKRLLRASSHLSARERSHALNHIDRLVSMSHRLWGTITVFAALILCVVCLSWVLWKRNRQLHAAYTALVEKIRVETVNTLASPHPSSLALGTNIGPELREIVRKILDDPAYYTQPDYSLGQLAQDVGSNSNYMSQIINKDFGMNFRALLNRQRVRYATRLFADPQYSTYSIEGIYRQCGFNSASTFSLAFKKEYGMSPSTFLRLLKDTSQSPPSPD